MRKFLALFAEFSDLFNSFKRQRMKNVSYGNLKMRLMG